MNALLNRAEARLHKTLRKTMLTIAGVIFGLTGIALFSTAGFIALQEVWGTIGTILFFAVVSFAISLILFFLARHSTAPATTDDETAKPVTVGELMDAFSAGMTAARRTK